MKIKKLWRTQFYICCFIGILLLFIQNSVWPMIAAPVLVLASLGLALWKLRCPKCGKVLLWELESRKDGRVGRRCPKCGEKIELL